MRFVDALVAGGRSYGGLAILLLAALVVQTFNVAPGRGGVGDDVVLTVLLLAIALVVFARSDVRRLMGWVLAGVLAAGWSRYLGVAALQRGASLAYHCLMILYLAGAVWVIVRGLYRRPAAGAQKVLGAICGYLIAGGAWCSANVLAYLFVPTAFHIDPAIGELMGDWHGRQAVFLYYSYSQLLTLGYSDVTPLHAPATTLSLLTAIFGIFYTAVVVSQLVSMIPVGAGPPSRDR